MDYTERLLHRFLNRQATPAEIHELQAIAATRGASLEGFVVADSYNTFDKEFNTVEIVAGDFDTQSLRAKKFLQALPKARQDTPKNPATKDTPTTPGLWWLNVAAAITLIVAAGLLYYGNYIDEKETASITYKGKQLVLLPDSSTVIMNNESELTLSPGFGKSDRTVFLKGEALFDVEHDPARPFVVYTDKVQTTVLGTIFNIKAKEGKVTVTVVRGRVQVGDNLSVYGQISRNEKIEVDTKANNFTRSNTMAAEALLWQQDSFILNNVTFSQAAALIEKRFNVTVLITNDSLKDCRVIASFLNNESLQEVVTGLCMVLQAKHRIEGNNVIIEGGKGCKPSE